MFSRSPPFFSKKEFHPKKLPFPGTVGVQEKKRKEGRKAEEEYLIHGKRINLQFDTHTTPHQNQFIFGLDPPTPAPVRQNTSEECGKPNQLSRYPPINTTRPDQNREKLIGEK